MKGVEEHLIGIEAEEHTEKIYGAKKAIAKTEAIAHTSKSKSIEADGIVLLCDVV